MSQNRNQSDDISQALEKSGKAIRAGKSSIKAAKKGMNAGKATLGAAKKAAAAVGGKAFAVVIAVILLFSVLTVGSPSTSFNSFTHVNELQDPITEEELEGKVEDLQLAKDAETEALNILGEVLKDEKLNVYERIEKECKREGVDYEATLQYIDSNFLMIGEEIVNAVQPGTYTEELYDACCILSAYSISVDNLYGDRLQKNWRQDMKERFKDYLESDDGRDFYKISYEEDENGERIEYTGVIDSSNDIEEEIEDYEDDADEDLVSEEGKSSSLSKEQEEKDKESEKDKVAELTPVSYIKVHVEKQEVTTFAFEAFGVTNDQIAELYGENSRNDGVDIVTEMAMNSLALLHDIEDFEAQLAQLSLPGEEPLFDIGNKIEPVPVIMTYCMCKKTKCENNRKSLFGVLSTLSIKDGVKRLPLKTCAASHIPVNTVIYDEDFGLMVVTEKIITSTPTVAIYTGQDHKVSKENMDTVEKILKKNEGGSRKKVFHIAEGITVEDALVYSNSASGLGLIAAGQISKQFQMKIVQYATNGNWYGSSLGWCQAWVANVFWNALGGTRNSMCCAKHCRDSWATKSSSIPVGAAIYSSDQYRSRKNCSACGRNPGHVGIYIGKRNGVDTVVSMVNGPTYQSLDSWNSYYGFGGWSWNGHYSTSGWNN